MHHKNDREFGARIVINKIKKIDWFNFNPKDSTYDVTKS